MTAARRTSGRRAMSAARHRKRTTRAPGRETNRLKEALQSGAGKIKHAVDEAAGEVWESLNGVGSAATDRARYGLEQFRNRVADYADEGQSQAQSLKTAFERKVQAQPVAAILAAAGAGFLLGAIWSRR